MGKKAYYQTIYDDLKEKIINGELKVGDKLPSEADLEKQYQFSRTPVRQALHKLEDKGYIYRLQGKGSFVANFKVVEEWTALTGFKSHYMDQWDKISARTITSKVITSQKIIHSLEFYHENQINYLERIRYYEDRPIIYMEHYTTSTVPLEVFNEDPNFVSAVSKIIREQLDKDFSKVYEEIEAVSATEKLANHLNLSVGYPLLKILRVAYIDNRKVDHNIYYTATDEWKYQVEYKNR